MKNFLIPLLIFSAIGSSVSAHAASGLGAHAGFDLGIWRARYTQEGPSQTVSIGSDLAPAFKLNAGLSFGSVFVDYTPEIYLAYFGDSRLEIDGEANDTDYFALLAGNIGVRFPLLHLNPYIGGGIGNFGFSFGTKADPSGPFIRAGVTFDLISTRLFSFGPRVEYQRLFLKNDEAGALPSGYSAHADVFFIGVGIRAGN
ncbi:MAG TPA: hypothetical protein DCS07_18185 [Bdellovibrionales bacterium]|nr:MAG: hypothetical protein A2Z97_01900 [Bdellovibrionales bacterium GWB1_52_6]OFZ04902.1 MAG: hypothetical protein A2X97_16175 [Bdellovibrionales bacterium GWA1_52_35]OFZ40435.1 MAG: hypothetical protein A2070_02215 [Bdellovibrionales bacterium GWC1_52_8]HAR44532.1 hypothetical protein [Bdellovibrionales bacterium]HCM38834.1 hypothetical protein [Bdellovibrionales bacterium]